MRLTVIQEVLGIEFDVAVYCVIPDGETNGRRPIELHTYLHDPSGEAVIALTPRGVKVGAASWIWQEAHRAVPTLGPVAHYAWNDLPTSPETLRERLVHDLNRARKLFLKSLVRCTDCGCKLPPHHIGEMDGRMVCHGCMEANHGVCF